MHQPTPSTDFDYDYDYADDLASEYGWLQSQAQLAEAEYAAAAENLFGKLAVAGAARIAALDTQDRKAGEFVIDAARQRFSKAIKSREDADKKFEVIRQAYHTH